MLHLLVLSNNTLRSFKQRSINSFTGIVTRWQKLRFTHLWLTTVTTKNDAMTRNHSLGGHPRGGGREEGGKCSTWCPRACSAPSRRRPAAWGRPRTWRSPAGSRGKWRRRPSARRGGSTPAACAAGSSPHCGSRQDHTLLQQNMNWILSFNTLMPYAYALRLCLMLMPSNRSSTSYISCPHCSLPNIVHIGVLW